MGERYVFASGEPIPGEGGVGGGGFGEEFGPTGETVIAADIDLEPYWKTIYDGEGDIYGYEVDILVRTGVSVDQTSFDGSYMFLKNGRRQDDTTSIDDYGIWTYYSPNSRDAYIEVYTYTDDRYYDREADELLPHNIDDLPDIARVVATATMGAQRRDGDPTNPEVLSFDEYEDVFFFVS